MIHSLRPGKLAVRLTRTYILLTAAPVACTAILLGVIGREEIVASVRTAEAINQGTLRAAGNQFQSLGDQAIERARTQSQAQIARALRSLQQDSQKGLRRSLDATAADFAAVTRDGFGEAMRQSVATHQATLRQVRSVVTGVFARSAAETQRRGAARIRSAMLSQIELALHERATMLASDVEDQVNEAPEYLRLAAQMPQMVDRDRDGQTDVLNALQRRLPQFAEICVVDRNGRETTKAAVDHMVSPQELRTVRDLPYFRRALGGEAYIAEEGSARIDASPVLRVAVPIEVYRGKVTGVLAARYSLDEIWGHIRSTRVGHGGYAYVLRGSGAPLMPDRMAHTPTLTSAASIDRLNWRIVVALPQSEALQPVLALQSEIADSSARAAREVRASLHAEAARAASQLEAAALRVRDAATRGIRARSHRVFDRFLATSSEQSDMQLNGLAYVLQRESSAVMERSNAQMQAASSAASKSIASQVTRLTERALHRAHRHLGVAALAIGGVSVCGSVLLGLLMAGRMVRPLQALVHGTRAIASGDLDERVDADAPDEIGDLAVAFNTMAASLRESRRALDEAQSQLVQSAKLASLGELSAGVAHELNQPVAIIRGTVQQLRDEEGLSALVAEDLALIESMTGRMIKIISHLRSFSRSKAVPKRIDPNQVTQDCFILIGQQLRNHDIEVVQELCDTACPVMAEANEIEQVLLNLIGNARDAVDGRPDAKITVRSYVERDCYVIEVRDNGPGIPEEIVGRIFDPFFTTKDPGKGTGLGLSISHSIVRKHHGELRAHNDGGAVFTMTLPLASDELPLAA